MNQPSSKHYSEGKICYFQLLKGESEIIKLNNCKSWFSRTNLGKKCKIFNQNITFRNCHASFSFYEKLIGTNYYTMLGLAKGFWKHN